MPSFWRSRYLTCFYCGRKTSTVNDGQVRRFDCPSCNETNYLDEDGEITDPPVPTAEAAPAASRYVVRSTLPSNQTSADEVFCKTCLKNQHLFVSSLAQYVPDDTDGPDDLGSDELQRRYDKFKKGLEQRYPLVCAECEPKALKRIQQAAYTAKTDHLRRMIDQSKSPTTKRSSLDIASLVGRRLWQAGLVLQLAWQISLLYMLASRQEFVNESSITRTVTGALRQVLLWLPLPDRLARWSVLASVFSYWWNPQLSQTVGRIHETHNGFAKMVQVMAPRSIRIDSTPLFGQVPTSLSPPPATRRLQAEDKKDMSDILDEILDSSPKVPVDTLSSHPIASDPNPFGYTSAPNLAGAVSSSRQHLGKQSNLFNSLGSGGRQRNEDIPLEALLISEGNQPAGQARRAYDEEMDWLPTQSHHRAFNTYDTTQVRPGGFGETPVGADHGQFWYKVPPAPVSIAQKIRNPLNAPRLRQSAIVKDGLSFHNTNEDEDAITGPMTTTSAAQGQPDVEFVQTTFFPPVQNNDPRSSLSDLFGQVFSLNPSQKEMAEASDAAGTRLPQRMLSRRFWARLAEIAVLAVCLIAWLHFVSAGHEYTAQVALGTMCTCIAISARTIGSSLYGIKGSKPLAWVSGISAALAVVELALASRIALYTWASGGHVLMYDGRFDYGTRLISALIVHQILGGII